MLYALAKDRQMSRLAYVDPLFRTPTFAIVLHATLSLALALAGSFRELALLSAVARLSTYLVTCLALPRLRKLNEGFRIPGPIVPVLGIAVSLVFMLNLDTRKIIAAAVALTVGAILYAWSLWSDGAHRRTAGTASES
jgi:amino acid transporter